MKTFVSIFQHNNFLFKICSIIEFLAMNIRLSLLNKFAFLLFIFAFIVIYFERNKNKKEKREKNEEKPRNFILLTLKTPFSIHFITFTGRFSSPFSSSQLQPNNSNARRTYAKSKCQVKFFFFSLLYLYKFLLFTQQNHYNFFFC